MNGTITSFVSLSRRSRNSIIPIANSSSFSSSILRRYSIVCPCTMEPLWTCSIDIYTLSSCSSYPNTSTSFADEFVIIVLLLNCSSNSILCLISAASSNLSSDDFNSISSSSCFPISCPSPFIIFRACSIHCWYSSCPFPSHIPQQFLRWYLRHTRIFFFSMESLVIGILHVRIGKSLCINSNTISTVYPKL